jgi:hypothetical protein
MQDINITLDGPITITRVVRPPRVAIIVQTLSDCEDAIKRCTLSWGGKHFCLIPYDIVAHITDEWWELIEMYDPDTIISYTDIDSVTEKRLLDIVSIFSGDKKISDHIDIIKNNVDGLDFVGRSIYSILAALEFSPQNNQTKIILPVFNSDNPDRFYSMAKYGYLDESYLYNVLSDTNINPDLKLKDFIAVEECLVSENYSFLIKDEISNDFRRNTSKNIPVIDISEVGLTIQASGKSIHEYGNKDIIFDVQQIIVISDIVSTADLCWYWNLRAQRYLSGYSLVLWLPKKFVIENIEDFQNILSANHRNFLISTDIDENELEELSRKINKNTEVRTENLVKFFDKDFFIGIKDQREINFKKNKARIPYPDSKILNGRARWGFFCVDIDVPDYCLPNVRVSSWDDWIFTRYRGSKTGITFNISMVTNDIKQYIDLVLPTPWQVIKTLADIGGYNVSLSDKGRIAEQVLNLLGGIGYFTILSFPPVYHLLEQMAELNQAREFKSRLRDAFRDISKDRTDSIITNIITSISSDRHERVYKNFGNIKTTLGFKKNKTVELLLSWLIEKKIVFRGIEITCVICYTKQWTSIKEMDAIFRCNACQQEMNIPIGVSTINWSYRINALYARAYDSGIMPHLLTIRGSMDSRKTFPYIIGGIFPGIVLKVKEGSVSLISHIELDIVLIENGKLIIGECKTNFRELTVLEVQRYIDLSKALKIQRIILSALDSQENIPDDTQMIIAHSPISIEIMSKDILLSAGDTPTSVSNVDLIDNTEPVHPDYESELNSLFEWMEYWKSR